MALRGRFAIALISVQAIFIVLFAFFVDYGEDLDAKNLKNYEKGHKNNLHNLYPMFQDVNVMIFTGVGFLYAFLKKYQYSGIVMNMVLAAIALQISVFSHNWWTATDGKIRIDVSTLISGEFAAASAVIALGGIFGKTSPLQMLVFTLLEVIVYTINEHLCLVEFKICDVGGSVSLHMFAGIFGCAAAYAVDRKSSVQGNPNEASSYESNVFCMLGTVLLWCFWPSFNSSLVIGDQQHRCMMNTFLALLGSCTAAVALSSLLDKNNKITMSHVQNGSLAGGVAIGAVADLMIHPFGALLVGFLGGLISVLGFKYSSPFLARMKIYDPCGINSLHALPGLFSGLVSVFAAFTATESNYGNSLQIMYPAMTLGANSSDLLVESSPYESYSRTPQLQACFQLLYIVQCIIVAIVTGLVTGLVMRFQVFEPLDEKKMYLDEVCWVLPEEKLESDKTVNDYGIQMDRIL